jgi:hypothetical protein
LFGHVAERGRLLIAEIDHRLSCLRDRRGHRDSPVALVFEMISIVNGRLPSQRPSRSFCRDLPELSPQKLLNFGIYAGTETRGVAGWGTRIRNPKPKTKGKTMPYGDARASSSHYRQ